MAHILIVEDEAPMRLLVRISLESAGHNIYEAMDGGDAIGMLKAYINAFDMILLDLLMPNMDGLAFLTILQTQSFRPAVLVLSAHSERIPLALENMVSGRLLKPFRIKELKDTVNRLLGVSTLTSQYPGTRTQEVTEHSLYTAIEN